MGKQCVHKKTGNVYTLVSCSHKHKEGDTWVESVIYSDADGNTYSRCVSDFMQQFTILS